MRGKERNEKDDKRKTKPERGVRGGSQNGGVMRRLEKARTKIKELKVKKEWTEAARWGENQSPWGLAGTPREPLRIARNRAFLKEAFTLYLLYPHFPQGISERRKRPPVFSEHQKFEKASLHSFLNLQSEQQVLHYKQNSPSDPTQTHTHAKQTLSHAHMHMEHSHACTLTHIYPYQGRLTHTHSHLSSGNLPQATRLGIYGPHASSYSGPQRAWPSSGIVPSVLELQYLSP